MQTELRQRLGTGNDLCGSPAEAAEALSPGMGALLRTPNNILGIEYCKAILSQNSPLRPMPLPRWGAAHGGKAGKYNGIRWPAPVICENSRCRSGRRLCRSRPWCSTERPEQKGICLIPAGWNGIAGAAAGGTAGAFRPGAGRQRRAGTPAGSGGPGSNQPGRPLHPPEN